MGKTTRIERVQMIADREELELKYMAHCMKVQPGILTKAMLGEAEIQDRSLMRLLNTFPQYATQWLLNGEGKMMVADKEEEDSAASQKQENDMGGSAGPSVRPAGAEGPEEKNDGWVLRHVTPTDRHYILLPEAEGMNYLMADAVMLFSKIEDGRIKVRSAGINYRQASAGREYQLEDMGDKILSDELDKQTLESMVRYKVEACRYTCEEAILAVKSDFERTNVRLDPYVRKLFATYD